jgi:hypothetical protein
MSMRGIQISPLVSLICFCVSCEDYQADVVSRSANSHPTTVVDITEILC